MKVVAYRRINGDSSLLMIWHFGVNGEGGGGGPGWSSLTTYPHPLLLCRHYNIICMCVLSGTTARHLIRRGSRESTRCNEIRMCAR